MPIIPNDRLLELADRSIGIVEAFKTADTALLAGVQGITDLITMNSYIHVGLHQCRCRRLRRRSRTPCRRP